MSNASADVLAGNAQWGVDCADALAFLRGLPDQCVSLVLFSPPYTAQRTYGISFTTRGDSWVEWLRPIVVEAARVCDGLVCVNAVGEVKDGSYSPVMECLVADLTRLDGLVCGPAPWCWWKVCGIPGSGSTRYQRRDWEPIYAVCRPDRLPLKWSDNTAFGHAPKCGPGGEMSNRTVDGKRVNQFGVRTDKPVGTSSYGQKDEEREGYRANDDPWKTKSRGGSNCGGRHKNGEKKKGTRHTFRVPGADGDVMVEQRNAAPPIANPGNVIQAGCSEECDSSVIEARVGGGHMGHALAHSSEAPMSLTVAERFVRWYCPPGGILLDPFAGSGTTLHAAVEHGRRAIGCDVRQSQVDLVRRRMTTVTPPLF